MHDSVDPSVRAKFIHARVAFVWHQFTACAIVLVPIA